MCVYILIGECMLIAEGGHTSESRMGILGSISLLIPNFHRDLVAIKV